MEDLQAMKEHKIVGSIDNERGLPEALYGFPVREPDYRETSDRKAYDIKKLWSRHKEIINLDSLGYKHTEIAKMVGVTPTCVQLTLNSTLGKEAKLSIRNLRDQEFDAQREKIMELTWDALAVYEETFNSGAASLKERREAARDIMMEMSGLRAPTQIESKTVSTILTKDELDELKLRGIEASRAAGKLIEVQDESEKTTE